MSSIDEYAMNIVKEIVKDEFYAQLLASLNEKQRIEIITEIYKFHKNNKIEIKDASTTITDNKS